MGHVFMVIQQPESDLNVSPAPIQEPPLRLDTALDEVHAGRHIYPSRTNDGGPGLSRENSQDII